MDRASPSSRRRTCPSRSRTSTQLCSDLVYGLVYPQIFDSHKRRSDEAQAATLARAKERAQTWLKVLDENILGPGNNYLCGDAITIADYFGACLVTLGEVIRCDFEQFPNVARWLGNVKKLKSWPKVNEVFYGLCDSVKEQKFNAI